MTGDLPPPGEVVNRQMRARNAASAAFFSREAEPLARFCRRMAERFRQGGRLLAFGRGPYSSDAQHIAVEFVHPVLVGKRALPALDLSAGYREWLPALLRPEDVVVGLGPPGGDPEIEDALEGAAARGALCLALPGSRGGEAIAAASDDPFIHQEIVETLYHTLWETVHVFLDREALGEDAGAAAFLYPFLAQERQSDEHIVGEVAASIRAKAATADGLRTLVAAAQGAAIAAAAVDIRRHVDRGGLVLCFGNGGSATDAADLAMDLVACPKGYAPVAAISLAADAATVTAIANDIGAGAIFVRQLIAHGRRGDVAIAISTSGGSANVVAALVEARARGLLTVALVGYDGGEVARRGLADHVLVIPSDQIPRVQEVQASVYHVMVDLLDAAGRAG